MKFYLMTDYEGVAGVYTWENRADESLENFERRMRGRRLLAREVDACVDGLYKGGAGEVIVNDGHGAGYTIDLDLLDDRPLIVHGTGRPFWLPYLDASCAATGLLGGHAKAHTPNANLAHTMSHGIAYEINGISMGEAGLQAAIAGHFGVPFVLVCGDAHLCKEMEALIPGVVTAAVKCGTGLTGAVTLAPQEAHELIRERAAEAMQRIGEVAPLKLEGPVHFKETLDEPGFDEWNPPPHSRVLNSRTREIEATDIIDLMNKLYGYDPQWQAPSYDALRRGS
ncbi:MAG: M55 family metallopeptidase [Armatimonadia bacterium]